MKAEVIRYVLGESIMLLIGALAVIFMHDWLLGVGMTIVLPILWIGEYRERRRVQRLEAWLEAEDMKLYKFMERNDD